MGKYEEKIKLAFIAEKKINGRIIKEFNVGKTYTAKDNSYEEKLKEKCRKLSCKRCDLVIENDNAIWFLEVKRKLNATSLGQLLSYEYLYRKDNSGAGEKKIRLGVVVEKRDKLLLDLFRHYNVEVFVVKV